MITNKDKLLRTAVELFAAKGIHQTSIRDIMRSAGVNSQLIYYYFGSKSQLVHEVIRHASEQTTAVLDEAEDTPTVPQAIHTIIANFTRPSVERALANRLIAQIVMTQDTVLLKQVNVTIESNKLRLKQLIERGVRDGSIRPDIDSTVAALSIIGLPMWFTMSASVSEKVSNDYDTLSASLYEILFFGMENTTK